MLSMPRQRQRQSAAPTEDEDKDCKELKMSHMAQAMEAGRQGEWRLGTKRETNKQVKIVINIKLISTCRRKFHGTEREMRKELQLLLQLLLLLLLLNLLLLLFIPYPSACC